jgi:hypothetical protein
MLIPNVLIISIIIMRIDLVVNKLILYSHEVTNKLLTIY